MRDLHAWWSQNSKNMFVTPLLLSFLSVLASRKGRMSQSRCCHSDWALWLFCFLLLLLVTCPRILHSLELYYWNKIDIIIDHLLLFSKVINILKWEEHYILHTLTTYYVEKRRSQKSDHFYTIICQRENQEVCTFQGHQGQEKQLAWQESYLKWR